MAIGEQARTSGDKTDHVVSSIALDVFGRYGATGSTSVDGQRRVIVVVGAGASNAACNLPLGRKLADIVKEQVFEASGLVTRRAYDKELERLEMESHHPPDEFETQLTALSALDSDTVLRVLQSVCNVAHYPSLTYEVLAHMMKHGFIDAIINFNFDELLDQAIDEELRPGRYSRIVFDGDCINELECDLDNPSRFRRPLYIKPHGTAGELQSLRFTRAAYFGLPPRIRGLLECLVQGRDARAFLERPDVDVEPRQRIPASILALGHAMQSFEFNDLLAKAPAGTRLFVATHQKPVTRNWPARLKAALSEGGGWSSTQDPNSLDLFMLRVWNAVRSLAAGQNDIPPPRGIERHVLVAHLFKPHSLAIKRGPGTDALLNYLQDRLVVELILAIAKSKGVVHSTQLYDGRPGRFFDLARREDPQSGPDSLKTRLESVGMQWRDATSELFWHETVEGSGLQAASGCLTATRDGFVNHTLPSLLKSCRERVTGHRSSRLADPKCEAILRNALVAMFDGIEVEVAPTRDTRIQARFENPKVLRNHADFRRVTRDLLQRDWDLVLSVAESGQWILTDKVLDSGGNRRGVIIVADTVYLSELRNKAGARTAHLHWHLHNKHMTILLKKTMPFAALYYERRYRSALITPVLIDRTADLEVVVRDFVIYWLKAERHGRGESEVISMAPTELQTRTAELIAEWTADTE